MMRRWGSLWWRVMWGRNERTPFGALAMVAVAVSVMVLVVSGAILHGFITLYEQGIVRFHAPIVVLPASESDDRSATRDLLQTQFFAPASAGSTDWSRLAAWYRWCNWGAEQWPRALQWSGLAARCESWMHAEQERVQQTVTAITPFLYREGMLLSGQGMQAVAVKGLPAASVTTSLPTQIHWWTDDGATHFAVSSDGPLSVLIGKTLADRLFPDGITDGTRLLMPTVQSPELGSSYSLPLRIVGTFTTGLHEFDGHYLLADLAQLQTVTESRDRVTGWELRLVDPALSAWVASLLAAAVGPEVSVQEWRALYRDAFEALATEKLLFTLLLGLLVIVAMSNIALLILLQLLQRFRSAAVLVALGWTPRAVQRLFWWRGICSGIIGIGCGLLLGAIVAWGLQYGTLVALDPEIYFVSSVPARLDGWQLIGTGLGCLALCALCSTWAVRRLVRVPLCSALGRGYV